MAKKEEESICGDCMGIAYVGGVNQYNCLYGGPSDIKLPPNARAEPTALEDKNVEERLPLECARFTPAPRMVRIPMKEYVEVGITQVYGNGSIQIPAEIRKALEIRDGDKILWIRKGLKEYTFRKVGARVFKPVYR